MKPYLKISIGILLNVSLLVNQVVAQMPNVSFESPDYVLSDPIQYHTAKGWQLLSGQANIVNGGGAAGQALSLNMGAQETWLRKEVTWDANEATAFIDFKIRPAKDPEGSLANFVANGSQIAFQVPTGSTTGNFWVFNGSDGAMGSSQWFQTGGTFSIPVDYQPAPAWSRVTLRHDYGRNLWDAFVDGKLVGVNLAFEQRGENLTTLEFFGSRSASALVDDVSVGTTNLLFPDADKDGLPDSWETANGSDPNVYDREAIKPGTGQSFLDHYLAEIWPSGGTVANGSTGAGSIGTIPPLTIMGQHQAVGSLKGEFSVGGDGSAAYSIPIDIPKGTAGLEPKLSLSYSSASGNGIVGLGFTLSGLQSITRGRATYRKDGFAGTEDFANDRFFLNGERLVCVSGTYGASGSEYRTEIDSYSRITLSGNAASGASSWKVETKAGLIISFGATADSRLTPASAPAPISWAVSQVADTTGNYYEVSYVSDSTADTAELKNHRLAEIRYTGNDAAGLVPYCAVSFLYEPRTDAFPKFTRGFKFTSDLRLKQVNVSTSGQANHHYVLGYGTSSRTKSSILTSVQRVQATGESIPATVIGWDSVADTTGRTQWGGSTKTEQNYLEWTSGKSVYSKFIDMNGDGLLDRVDHYNYQTSQPGLWVSINTGSGFLARERWYLSTQADQNIPEWYSGHNRLSTLVDMNGDGLPDRVDHHNYQTNQGGLWVSLNTGTGFGTKTQWYSSTNSSQNQIEWWDSNGLNQYSGLIDLNDDGRPDRVDHHDYASNQAGIWVSLNTGTGFSAKTRWYQGTGVSYGSLYGNGTLQNNFQFKYTFSSGLGQYAGNPLFSTFMDVNGDGRPDRIDHMDYKGTSTEPGLWVSLNTGSAFATKVKWLAHAGAANSSMLENGMQTTPKFISKTFCDLNGDGLPDRLEAGTTLTIAPNTGSAFSPAVTWNNDPSSMGNLPYVYDTLETLKKGFMDLNADGLPDRVTDVDDAGGNGGLWVAWNTGKQFGTKAKWYTGTAVGQNSYRWTDATNVFSDLIDMDGDGLLDRVDSRNHQTNEYGIWVSRNNGTSFGPRVKWFSSTKNEENNVRWDKYSGFIDINGDGLPDRFDHKNQQSGQFGFWISLNKGTGYNEYAAATSKEVVTSLTDGFGSELRVEYRRLNDPTPIPGFNSRVYQKGPVSLPAGQSAVIDSRLVVSRYSGPDGLGGRRYKAQRYGDLRYDRESQTSLGFGWVEGLDELNGQVSRSDMMRAYPFAGSPAKVEQFILVGEEDLGTGILYPSVTAGLKLVSRETATYDELTSQTGTGGTIRRPIQIGSEKSTYDLDGDLVTPGTLKIRTTTVQAKADFDPYGFVRKSTITHLDGSTFVTQNVYGHGINGDRWHLGRLQRATVTKSGGGRPTLVNRADFEYSEDTGLLTAEITEITSPLSKRTEYLHDAFGNITDTTVYGTTGGTRFSTTHYDARGRFVIGETNALSQSTSHTYDQQRALLLSSTDVGGRTSWFHYDAFGTLMRTDLAGGLQSGEITGSATNASVPSWVASELGAHQITYFRAKEQSGAPAAYVYLDAMGRELVTRTTVLRDATATGSARYSPVYTVTRYDERGRKIAASLPFAQGETPLYGHVTYDFLDRALVTLHPDGSVDQALAYTTMNLVTVGLPEQPVTYSAVSNSRGQTLHRYEDQHGRLIQSRDASLQITTFHYDHNGRLVRVAINAQDMVRNTYDSSGNKTSVWEANSGTSYSYYNSFGEVTSSKNANNQTTAYTYDNLGRVLSAAKPEGTYLHYYDGARGAGAGLAWKTTGPGGYLDEISYDPLGRPASTRQVRFNETFTTSTSYDALGRVLTHADAGGLVVRHDYDPLYSFPVSLTLAGGVPGVSQMGAGTILWQAGTFDSSGRALTQTLAQGVEAATAYNPANGLAQATSASRAGTPLQNKTYDWDGVGNLSYRTDSITGRTEVFSYDALNRLSSATVGGSGGGGASTETYGYDARGNLLSKGAATLTYGGTRPHAVMSANVKGFSRAYSYDAAGQVTADGKRTYTWTSFGQLATLTYQGAPPLDRLSGTRIHDVGEIVSTFDFNADGTRTRQVTSWTHAWGFHQRQTTLYLGSFEREHHQEYINTDENGEFYYSDTKSVFRHTVAPGVVYSRVYEMMTGTRAQLTTVLKDHLGSTDVLLVGVWNSGTSSFGAPVVERQAFDAWGERRNAADWSPARTSHTQPFLTSAHDYDRGYTGHEQLDDSGLIHMNGRIYDPELGRMLSPDPIVQAPEYSQNFNRYSYVMNNPLNMTDPTGFSWLSKMFHKLGDWISENFITIVVVIVVAIVTWGVGTYFAAAAYSAGSATAFATGVTATMTSLTWAGTVATAAIAGAVGGGLSAALAGGDWSDILKGMVVGAVQGAITAGVLNGMQPASYGLSWETAGHVVGHGVVGGAANVAMGGKFSDGFISAASSAFAADMGWNQGGTPSTRVIKSAAIGGTISAIGGGKFANGAATAAFQSIVSELGDAIGREDPEIDKKALKYSGEVYKTNDGGLLAEELGIKYSDYDRDGFGAALYRSGDHYYMAYRGTQLNSLIDWRANIMQGLGLRPSQYEMAVALAYLVRAKYGQNVTFVGHSLGGGLATAAAYATRGNAVTFNSAGLSWRYKLGSAPGNITAHYIRGEILSTVQDFMPIPGAVGLRVGYSGVGSTLRRHDWDQFYR